MVDQTKIMTLTMYVVHVPVEITHRVKTLYYTFTVRYSLLYPMAQNITSTQKLYISCLHFWATTGAVTCLHSDRL